MSLVYSFNVNMSENVRIVCFETAETFFHLGQSQLCICACT